MKVFLLMWIFAILAISNPLFNGGAQMNFFIANCFFLAANVILLVTLFSVLRHVQKSHLQFLTTITRIINELKAISSKLL